MGRERRAAAPLALLLGAVACAGHGSGPERPRAAATATTAELLPLKDGSVLAYETDSEPSGERGLVVLQVSRPRAGFVELHDGGQVRRLTLEPLGVRHSTGGYWLKEPLRSGSCWSGHSGETCVTHIDVSVTVPAGHFTGCLRTVERISPSSRVTTVFCPGVGMVSLDAEGQIEGEPSRERALLRSHGPRIDLDVPSPR